MAGEMSASACVLGLLQLSSAPMLLVPEVNTVACDIVLALVVEEAMD